MLMPMLIVFIGAWWLFYRYAKENRLSTRKGHVFGLLLGTVLATLVGISYRPEPPPPPPTPEQLRKQEIERIFNQWDGSIPSVVEAVKAHMHDPDSFRHVKTVYRDAGDHLVVRMTYRGTNLFGGVVTHTAVATVRLDGSLHTFIAAR